MNTSHSFCRPASRCPLHLDNRLGSDAPTGGGADVRESFISMAVKVMIQAHREGVLLDTFLDFLDLLFAFAANLAYAAWRGVIAVVAYPFKRK
jgi:hypothetical protein